MTASRESLFCVCVDVTKQKKKVKSYEIQEKPFETKCSESAASVMIIKRVDEQNDRFRSKRAKSEHHGQQVPYKTPAALGKSQNL